METRITILGNPITKKNHQRIIRSKKKSTNDQDIPRLMVIQSARYIKYERESLKQIKSLEHPIETAVNVECVYYMENRRRVDLVNLLEATDDILVRGGILKDDCSKIVAAHDGSRVLYDKESPRVEITITEMSEWQSE